MNILFVNKFFHLNGGSERVFFQEREFLKEQGNTVIDFSMTDDRNFKSIYSDYFVPNIDYQNVKGIKKKISQGILFVHSSVAVKNIERLIAREKPQIAHLHNIYHQLTPSLIPVLKKHGVKVVLTLHDYKLICPGYLALKDNVICTECENGNFLKPFLLNCQNSRSQGLLLSIEAFWHKWRKSYEGVDLFISPSWFLADLVSRRVSSDKLTVLKNGIDISEYTPNYSDSGYGLYLGRLSREKGIETLLDAQSRNGKKLFPLKIVGTGPIEKVLQKKYPDAEFSGYQTGETVRSLISNAAYVVVPSEWYENCSMVVLEAMAMGKPVIGSRIGGIPEQVEDGKTGFLFKMGDVRELAEKMEVLSGNAGMRVEMGKASRQKIENEYALDAHFKNLMKLYENVLSYANRYAT